jgi:hypothetical protein
MASACGGATAVPGATIDGGTCGNADAAGGMCNALANVGSRVVPTCTSGTVPTGVGGATADGTYVLSSQTYYNLPGCNFVPVTGTFAFQGGCVEAVVGADVAADGGMRLFTVNGTVSVQGNEMTLDITCVPNLSGATPDAPVRTFTATGSTLTWYIRNSAAGNPNPDRVEVYTKQ